MLHKSRPYDKLSSLLFGHYKGDNNITGVLKLQEHNGVYAIDFVKAGVYDRVAAVVADRRPMIGRATFDHFAALKAAVERNGSYNPSAEEFVFLESQTEIIDRPPHVRILHGLKIREARMEHGHPVLRFEQYRDGVLEEYERLILESMRLETGQ